MHLVDQTLFYSPTSGGVKRYLTAKHAWLGLHGSWTHTILVPGERERMERGGICSVEGYPVPGTFNYRHQREVVVGFQARFHNDIAMSGGEQAVGVAVATVPA